MTTTFKHFLTEAPSPWNVWGKRKLIHHIATSSFVYVTPAMIRKFLSHDVHAMHGCSYDDLINLSKIQHTRNNISTFTSMNPYRLKTGIESPFHVIVHVKGKLVYSNHEDLMSRPDERGLRGFSVDAFPSTQFITTFFDEKIKFLSTIFNELATQVKQSSLIGYDVAYKHQLLTYIDNFKYKDKNHHTEYHNHTASVIGCIESIVDDKNNSSQFRRMLTKFLYITYVGGFYKLCENFLKNIIDKYGISVLTNTITDQTNANYNEILVSNFEIVSCMINTETVHTTLFGKIVKTIDKLGINCMNLKEANAYIDNLDRAHETNFNSQILPTYLRMKKDVDGKNHKIYGEQE